MIKFKQMFLLILRKLFKDLVDRSDEFEKRISFPVEANDIRYCFPPQEVVENARKRRPILHAEVVRQIARFLDYKVIKNFGENDSTNFVSVGENDFGNEQELVLYKDMTVEQMVQRLILNRPLVYLTFFLIYPCSASVQFFFSYMIPRLMHPR